MKKIGVITFWTSSINYGQVLQCYAFQTYLKGNGYDAYVIRFNSFVSEIKTFLKLIIKGSFLKHLKQTKLRNFNRFKKDHIQYSNKYYKSYYTLKHNPPKADYYIVGSDQVWAHMRNKERRNAYLLNFISTNNKLSYAASFGRDYLNSNEVEDFRNALNKFAFVGVREESGIEICNKLNIESSWVTDPVTLLPNEKWQELLVPLELNKDGRPSIFVYTLDNEKENPNIKDIKEYFKLTHNIYYCNSSEESYSNTEIHPTINEWLSYINLCDIVITDSFHCTMFCIIFNKKFVTIKRNNGIKMSNRLTSMLSRLGIIERYTNTEIHNIKYILDLEVDWNRVNYNLKEWTEFSKKLLLKHLK